MEQWRPIPPEDPIAVSLRSTNGGERHPRSLIDHLGRTVRWIGWGRIAVVVVSVPLVGWGGYYLVRPPAAPVEASLTYASTIPSTSVSTASPPDRSVLTVHVAGRVSAPGVFQLSLGSRIVDAVRAAGGAAPDADLHAVNLARPLEDGQQVYVPAQGERPPGSAAGPLDDSDDSTNPDLPVNINSATVEDLDRLPGIGPTTATAIVAHRDQHGPFASTDGLLDVPGIGPAKLAALSGLVAV